jgi:short-subunit dehydrogenase
MDVKGKVVFISGASRGIGAELGRQLAAQGARVVLAARTREPLVQLASELRQLGATALDVQLDVTSEVSVRAAVATALAAFGAIDVLINNAGNGGTLGRLLEQSPDHTREMFDVHVLGVERLTRAVLPGMLGRGQGRVMMVGSAVGYVAMPGAAAYSAAKAAVVALADALRGELQGTGVEVVCLSPPHTQTEAGKAWPLALPKQFSPEQAARALVRALRADEQNYLTCGNQSLLWLRRITPSGSLSIMRKVGLEALQRVEARG